MRILSPGPKVCLKIRPFRGPALRILYKTPYQAENRAMIMRIGAENKIVPDDWKLINVSRCAMERKACSPIERALFQG